MVVNRALADRYWPEGALGERIVITSGPERGRSFEVVGVVADTRFSKFADHVEPLAYFPVAQRAESFITILARTERPAAALARELREALRAEFPRLDLLELISLDEQFRRAHFSERLNANVTGWVGLLGLLMAVVGVFSVMAYAVSRRVREIGIRMAVGATRRDARELVLREAAVLILSGVVVGLGASFALVRLVESQLYGITGRDPLTFVAVPAVLTVAALAAAWLPARRAARVEPVVALRQQ